jgi:hypothetical protein
VHPVLTVLMPSSTGGEGCGKIKEGGAVTRSAGAQSEAVRNQNCAGKSSRAPKRKMVKLL